MAYKKLSNKLSICLPGCAGFVVPSEGQGVDSLDGPAEETPEETSDGCGEGPDACPGVSAVERPVEKITIINIHNVMVAYLPAYQ